MSLIEDKNSLTKSNLKIDGSAGKTSKLILKMIALG